jgi:hypothetical protein
MSDSSPFPIIALIVAFALVMQVPEPEVYQFLFLVAVAVVIAVRDDFVEYFHERRIRKFRKTRNGDL